MNNLSNNVKKVMVIFLLLFVALITHINYTVLFKSDAAVQSVYNKRNAAEKSKILRGSIFDRDNNLIVKGEKTGEFTQNREYIGGVPFAHVIGYYDEVYGMSGIEKKLDEELSGKSINGIKDFLSFFKFSKEETKEGNNVITTINSDLQKKAYDLLGNKRGSVVALDPTTGEVLAMVSKPGFNPNTLKEDWEKLSTDTNTPFLNRAVSGLYPPGSTFKAVTAISALENISGVTNKTFKDEGRIQFNKSQYLENYKGKAFGSINLEQGFTVSSNVVFGSLAMDLGNDTLRATAEKFLFNKDIPSRTLTIDNSKFPTYKKEEIGNIAQSGIGQSGVLASPIEMALVAGTIANNGIMMEPNVVKQIVTANGEVVKSYEPKEIGTITSSDNAELLKKYMRSVVTKGTGKDSEVYGVQVSGKTGTADQDTGKKIPHSWYIGFAPYENPKIAFAIIVEEGGNDSYNATDMAGALMKSYFGK
ncbi:peptidoglycan D,D-transpeptidase FtsI family protein [Clostridium sp. UBA4548]|uniref:peptidoglycan D,D-transpeptidase FtsI family protein n=1 Tax=Clostridium sp. UBA4548 TaxID=1946361 RepID=UPI0025C2569A|nr:penicillin-binding transpeptidase domain-containing protein [Clostridium sp. UBA4548]